MSDSMWPHRRQLIRLLSLRFSRREHWSGLPFPSPVPEGEKVKVKSLSHVRPGSSVLGITQAKVLAWVAIAFSIFHVHLKVYFFCIWMECQSIWYQCQDINEMSIHISMSRYQWDPSHLMYCLTCVSLLILFWWSVHWCEWAVKVSCYYCVIVNFSFYVC